MRQIPCLHGCGSHDDITKDVRVGMAALHSDVCAIRAPKCLSFHEYRGIQNLVPCFHQHRGIDMQTRFSTGVSATGQLDRTLNNGNTELERIYR